jgi:hypothetical protein
MIWHHIKLGNSVVKGGGMMFWRKITYWRESDGTNNCQGGGMVLSYAQNKRVTRWSVITSNKFHS